MEDRVRELLDQEDSQQQRRILSSLESFKRWLSLLGDILDFVINLNQLYLKARP